MSFFNNLATFVVISTDLWVLGQYIYICLSFFSVSLALPKGMDFFAWCWILLAAAGQRSGAEDSGGPPIEGIRQGRIINTYAISGVFFFPNLFFFLSIKQSTGDPLRKIPDTYDLWLLGCPYLETVTQERVWDFLKSQSTWNPGKSTKSVDLYPPGN